MVDFKRFTNEMEISISRMETDLEEFIKHGLSAAYLDIFLQWPAYTYYSMANNVVSKASPIETPIPEERPNNKDELADDAAIQLNTGLQFIETFRLNKTRETLIYLSNPVDYAYNVGFNAGAGEQIYNNATQVAEETIEREWLNRVAFGT